MSFGSWIVYLFTKKIKVVVWLLVLLGTAFAAWAIVNETAADVVNAVAGGYVALVGIFLGLDITDMLRQSAKKPEGDYKATRKFRYIYGTVALLGMYALVRINPAADSLVTARVIFAGGGMGVLTFFVGALMSNKIAAGVAGSENEAT